MIDVALNTSGDLLFTQQDLQTVDGVNEIAQNLKIRLGTFLGEYYLNVLVGIPYYQDVFVKPANQIRVDSIFKNEILNTNGIASLIKYESEFNNSTREYIINFRAQTITGETIDQQLELSI